RIRKVFCLRSICCFQRQGHGNFVGVMSRHGTAPPRVLPFSNKTEMACLYSILFKRPPQKNRDLTNGSWLNGAQVPFREYKSNKMVEEGRTICRLTKHAYDSNDRQYPEFCRT